MTSPTGARACRSRSRAGNGAVHHPLGRRAAARDIAGDHRGASSLPDNNDAFLDTVIADVARITGRVYGQSTYDRLMRTAFDAEHIKRRPSAPTVRKAIQRYHESPAAATPAAA